MLTPAPLALVAEETHRLAMPLPEQILERAGHLVPPSADLAGREELGERLVQLGEGGWRGRARRDRLTNLRHRPLDRPKWIRDQVLELDCDSLGPAGPSRDVARPTAE